MSLERGGSAESDPPRPGSSDAGVHAFADDLALELRDGAEDVQLELSGRICIRRINSLRRTDQSDAMRLKLRD